MEKLKNTEVTCIEKADSGKTESFQDDTAKIENSPDKDDSSDSDDVIDFSKLTKDTVKKEKKRTEKAFEGENNEDHTKVLDYTTTPYDISNPKLDNTFELFHDKPEEIPSKIKDFGQRDITNEFYTFDRLENVYKKSSSSKGYGNMKETYVPGSDGNFIKSSLNEKSKVEGSPFGYIIAHSGYMYS